MASTSYTKNLGLCAWRESDRPKRVDFVNDNQKIDTALGEHLNNSYIHVTTQDKNRIYSQYKIMTYAGTGEATKTLALDDEYTFAIVYQKFSPLETTDEQGNTVLHFAIVTRVSGSNASITLGADSIVVTQDSVATDGVKNNFNEQYGQYVIILFR